jgi:lipopolysaccharide export system permease protein
MGVLSRYVLKRWFLPFLGILTLVTAIFLLQKILYWLPKLIENDVPFALSLQLFISLLPNISLMVLPVSYFFALYRVVKSFQANSELDAMYAGGLSLFNIFSPVLFVGVILAFFLLGLTMQIVPASKLEIHNTVEQLSSLRSAPSLVPQRFSDIENITFYFEGKDKSGAYAKVIISDARDDKTQPTLYFAKRATISKSDIGLLVQLFEGDQLGGHAGKLNLTHFQAYQIQVPLVLETEYREMQAESNLLYMNAKQLYHVLDQSVDDTKPFAEWQRRWIPPISLLILFFLAIPLSLQRKRSNKGGSFILALVILAVMTQSQLILAKKISFGVLPWWSTWVLEACYALLAYVLFMQVNQYGSLSWKRLKIFWGCPR